MWYPIGDIVSTDTAKTPSQMVVSIREFSKCYLTCLGDEIPDSVIYQLHITIVIIEIYRYKTSLKRSVHSKKGSIIQYGTNTSFLLSLI